MYRNLCLLVVLAVALMGVLSAPQAMAQAESPCRFVEAEEPVVEDDPLSDDAAEADAADDADDAAEADAADDADDADDMGPVFGDDAADDDAAVDDAAAGDEADDAAVADEVDEVDDAAVADEVDEVDDAAAGDEVDDAAVADMGPVFGDDFVIDSAEATPLPTCADAASYPGPFTNTPAPPSGPFAIPDVQIAPAQRTAVTAVVAETPSPSLAHSGSEVFVLAYLGTGLLAFGAVALGMRRSSVPR